MNENKKALLGLHDETFKGLYEDLFVSCGYKVDMVSDIDQMLKKAEHGDHSLYFMDANLGSPGDDDISACVKVYGLVKSRVEGGLAKFLAVSANDTAVLNAKNEEVPAIGKTDFTGYMDKFLGE